MARIRVLQIFSRYQNPGGEENSVYRIGDALQEQFDVEYLLGSTEELLGDTYAKKMLAPLKAYHNFRAIRLLKRYQEVGHFDVWLIHNVLPGLSPSVYQTASQLGTPMIHYLHNYRMGCINGFFLNKGSPCERCLNGNFWPAFETGCWHNSRLISGIQSLVTLRIRQLHVFQRVSAWVALSQAQRQKHIQIGLPPEKIHVIPHFYEHKESSPPPNPNGDILFLGRLSPEKGIDQLLRAWKLLPQTSRKLNIAGDGPELTKLHSLVRELGLTNVNFLGFLDKSGQREIWSRTAFSVIPSIWSEPFPLTFLESWSNSRTFVSNRLGAMAEVVQDGRDGLLAAPFNPSALAEQMQKLISSPSDCQRMGEAGLRRIQNDFNKDLWLNRISSLVTTTLNAASRGVV